MTINKVIKGLQSLQNNKRLMQTVTDVAQELLVLMPPSKLKQVLTQLNNWQTGNLQGSTGSESLQSMSNKGINVLKGFEGLRLEAYQDIGGVWTIGYGHTSAAGGMKVDKGLIITNEQAEQLLKDDLARMTYPVIKRWVDVPLTQGQFDALASFTYNLGEGQVSKSTLLKLLNNQDYQGAANEFERWVYAGNTKVNGLIRRRENERELFES